MKMTEPKAVVVQGTTFYIYPFSAFKAANLSGELIALLGPMLGGLASLVSDGEADGNSNTSDTKVTAAKSGSEDNSFLDKDIDWSKVSDAMGSAFSTLSGDKVESILRKLLIANRNITAEYDGQVSYLDEDILNDIFCGEIQGMYVLAYHVIKNNFGGFFAKFESQSGSAIKMIQQIQVTSKNTED